MSNLVKIWLVSFFSPICYKNMAIFIILIIIQLCDGENS